MVFAALTRLLNQAATGGGSSPCYRVSVAPESGDPTLHRTSTPPHRWPLYGFGN